MTSSLPTLRAITSQNDATPKLNEGTHAAMCRAITSQNDATPKPLAEAGANLLGAITSQNDATPKPKELAERLGS